MNNFNNLLIWNLGIELAEKIYEITRSFPRDEVYGLISQMRRAAVSIPSNIAEGSGRRTNKDFRSFLFIALGSLREIQTQLIISKKLGYLKNEKYLELLSKSNILGFKINNFIKKIKV